LSCSLITSQHEMKMIRVFINFPFENTWNGSSQSMTGQDSCSLRVEYCCWFWWLAGSVGVCSVVVWRPCSALCRAVSCLLVEGVFLAVSVVVDCGDVTVRCVVLSPSVCILLLSFCSCSCFFFCFLVGVPFPRRRCVLSSPVQSSFVRSSHVWSVYCMHYNCQQFTRRFAVPEYVWTDRQLSCNGSRSYSSMAWNFLPEYDTCVTSCVCVFSSLLFVSLFQKYILTHTRCSCSCSSQCMNECHDSVRRMIWQTVDRWPMTLCWFVPDRGSIVSRIDKTLYTYTVGVNGNTTTSRYTPLGPRSSLTGMEGREWIIATIA